MSDPHSAIVVVLVSSPIATSSNSAMEAQASGSYPAADHSNSAMVLCYVHVSHCVHFSHVQRGSCVGGIVFSSKVQSSLGAKVKGQSNTHFNSLMQARLIEATY